MAPTADSLPITFAIPGQSGAIVTPAAAARGASSEAAAGAATSPLPGQVKASVRLGLQRDGAAPVQVTAVPGEDIIALHIENGPVLLLHPATVR